LNYATRLQFVALGAEICDLSTGEQLS
jgi:hypothetical protein